MSEGDNDFLSRWSRRKVEARGGGLSKKVEPAPEHKPGRMRTDPPKPREVAEATETEVTAEQELVREAALQPDQAPVPPDDASAPDDGAPGTESEEAVDPDKYEDFDFDSLNYASDYTQFLKKGVPEAVRRRALRMLWGSNPILANIDGLNDYDEDFTDAALAVKVLSSNYKPGRGYLTEEERIASYSEEARKAGQSDEDDAEENDLEDSDVEDMNDDDESPDDVRNAAAPEGDSGDEDTSDKDDLA